MVNRGFNNSLNSGIQYSTNWSGFTGGLRRPGATISFDQDVESYLEDALEDEDVKDVEDDLYGPDEVDLMNLSEDFIYFCFPNDDRQDAEEFTEEFLDAVDRYAQP